jgi:ornithine carbamoyltransferase
VLKHVLSLQEFNQAELTALIRKAIDLKQRPEAYHSACERKGILMLFQKTSTRTNLSFQSGMKRMGGYTVVMDWNASNWAVSPIKYEARYVSRNTDLIMARLKRHDDLAELAAHAAVPVINGCCDRYHPCQALADMMTIYEASGRFDGLTLTYVGIHNNVANSLAAACMTLGVRLLLVTPIVNEPSWDESLMKAALQSGLVERRDSLEKAIAESDYAYTDTWIDMEYYHDPAYAEEKQRRLEVMLPYQLSVRSLQGRKPYIMHDMPIHPGYEIEEALIEADHSIIYQQAENRMYAQQALMLHLLGCESDS